MKKTPVFAAALAVTLSLASCSGSSDDSGSKSLINKLFAKADTAENTKINEKITTTARNEAETDVITSTETSQTTVTEDNVQESKDVSKEKKIFEFVGGTVECTEYKYYIVDEYDDYKVATEYINFSANVNLDNFPDSARLISNTLAEIGNAPSDDTLAASWFPEGDNVAKMAEYNQINSVFVENGVLFVIVDSFSDGGGGGSLSVYANSTAYIFDIKTGNQLTVEQLFKDFNEIKRLAVEYADIYVKENIEHETYSAEPYMERLNESEWYAENNWEYDGERFIVHFGWVVYNSYIRDVTADIPADVIRPYFVTETSQIETEANKQGLKDVSENKKTLILTAEALSVSSINTMELMIMK